MATDDSRTKLETLREIIEHLEEEQIEETKKFQAAKSANSEVSGKAVEETPADPSDMYFQGWLLSRDAEKYKADGKVDLSREKLEKALELFNYIAKEHPAWKPEMVGGRLTKTKADLASLSPDGTALSPEAR